MNELPKVCDYNNYDNEPCYGKIDEFWNGGVWSTFCEGHKFVPFGGDYISIEEVEIPEERLAILYA